VQRIMIIGPCGSGKSTLARTLGERLGLPVYHMDQLAWRPGWIESESADLRSRLRRITETGRWVIDGHYGGTLDLRLARTDTVVYLDFPIWLCLWRVLRRIAKWRGQTRPDMTEGCPERLDVGFLLYVLRWNVGPGPRAEAKLRNYDGPLVRLKNPAEVARWLDRATIAHGQFDKPGASR
jgi:adenylate kinase family enzyme